MSWLPAAERRLTKLWLESRSASRITQVVDRFDVLLAEDPLAVGESRAGDARIVIEWPIAISFDVDTQTHSVTIVDVWLI